LDIVRIGFIGAGSHANRVHYPSLSEMRDVEITAVCDLNIDRLNSTADKYNVTYRFINYKEMIEKVSLDGVFIIMPPHHLYDIVVYCLKHRLNVFIEKPPGVTSYQTESLARIAGKYGCKTMVGFNRRFIPLIRQVREIVEKNGPIIHCIATFYKGRAWGEHYYNGAVDILTCDAIHAVDMLRWMGGGVDKVVSIVSSFYSEFENSFNALIRFRNGCIGILSTNWAVGGRIHLFEMHSRGVSALINPDDKAVIFFEDRDKPLIISTQEAAKSSDWIKYYGFYYEDRHFIDAIKNDFEPETNFNDAVKTMKLIDLIYKNKIN